MDLLSYEMFSVNDAPIQGQLSTRWRMKLFISAIWRDDIWSENCNQTADQNTNIFVNTMLFAETTKTFGYNESIL